MILHLVPTVARPFCNTFPFPSSAGRKTTLQFSFQSGLKESSLRYPSIQSTPDHIYESSLDKHDEITIHGVSDTIVGVLGGGQLGRMLCQAASQMAVKVVILDPLDSCPASSIAYEHIVWGVDVEIEHVDAVTLEKLELQGIDCQPKASTIRIIQDKYLQKVHFSQYGIPLPDFLEIHNLVDIEKAGELFGYPLMIKSKRLAYDGRGNAVAYSKEEVLPFLTINSCFVTALGGFEHDLHVERWTPFVKELSVIVARARDHSIRCFPVVETIHRDNICHIVEAPADVPDQIKKLAVEIAQKAIGSLDGAGVFAVELFLTKDKQIVVKMPKGIPVATVAIGNAANAALLAVRILAANDSDLSDRVIKYQNELRDTVLAKATKLEAEGWERYLNE
ncbi:hypothetical protein ZIOFF_020630 [Zingiber officinale]|uniref:phosphoribosylaminoimidazole carboxylase n=1 Tax=Zingiber officinale TaxID=94328 RepID=A0A8J5LGQ4_ZINOF|nr:hypothetical protein ZIOFF_020630 [Zingiber officinale]